MDKAHLQVAKLTPLDKLTPLELHRKIRVKEAAELNAIDEQTFRRYYKHLIRKITPNRDVVELRDALMLPPAPSADH